MFDWWIAVHFFMTGVTFMIAIYFAVDDNPRGAILGMVAMTFNLIAAIARIVPK